MSKKEKLILKLLSGNADSNFDFDDLVNLLHWFELAKREGKGSHRIFYKRDIYDMINLQPLKGKAKPFQVKQVRDFLVNHKLINNE